jgi:hypothetical protein
MAAAQRYYFEINRDANSFEYKVYDRHTHNNRYAVAVTPCPTIALRITQSLNERPAT